MVLCLDHDARPRGTLQECSMLPICAHPSVRCCLASRFFPCFVAETQRPTTALSRVLQCGKKGTVNVNELATIQTFLIFV